MTQLQDTTLGAAQARGTDGAMHIRNERKASTIALGTFSAPGTGTPVNALADRKTVRAKVAGTGVVSATVQIYGSTENSTANGVLLATLSPSGTTSASDGAAFDAPWPYLWAVCGAISGTGAALDVAMGA